MEKNQIKIGAIISYFAIIFNIISGIIYTPWMISQIGKNDYGLYTLAYSLITLFTVDFGMGAGVTRFLSKYRAEKDIDGINNFLGIVYKLYLIIDIIIFIVLIGIYFCIENIYMNLSVTEIEKFKILYIIVGLFTIISFPFTNLNGILTAHEKFIQLKLCDLFYKGFTVLLIVIALLNKHGVYALVLVNSITALVNIFVKLRIIRRSTQIKVNFRYSNRETLKQIFGFSIWVTISSLAQRLIFNITPSIIAAISPNGSEEVAIFGLSSSIEGYVFTFANAINGMFMPTIARIISSNRKKEDLMPLMVNIGRFQIIVIGTIVIGFISFGRSFITDIWVTSDFIKSYYCVVALILPSLFYLPMQIANTTLIVENKVKLQAYVFILMGIINFVLSTILSKFMGALGASISIFIAYMIRTILMAVIYKKFLYIDMKYFIKNTFVRIFPYLLIMMIIGLFLENFNPISNIYFKFILNGIIFVSIFVVLLMKFVLNDYEKDLIKKIIKKS